MTKVYKTNDGFIYRYDSKFLLPVKEKRLWKWPLMLILFVVIIGIATPVGHLKSKTIKNFLIPKHVPTLTDHVLLDSLRSWNVYFPELVLKQMKLETGNYKSNIFLKTNNLMGMTYPTIRKTTAIGKYISGKYKYACYENWIESAKDYLIFQQTYFKPKYYHQFLNDVGYAEDISYIDKLNYGKKTQDL